MQTPLVTIIVPVFNRENTVEYCIRSILQLNYKNFELFIIDDGSYDNTNSKCLLFAENDSRVKVITQKNKGVSSARNKGIEESSGEWITFIDSDDIVKPTHLDIIITQTKTVDLILTQRSSIRSNQESYGHIKEELDNNKEIEGKKNVVDYLFGEYDPYNHPIYSCVDKFFRSDIVKTQKIRFREDISLGEDQIFVLNYLQHVNSFIHNKNVTYFCVLYDSPVEHLGSKSRTVEDLTHCFSANFKAFNELLCRIESVYLSKYAYNYLFHRFISRILFHFRDFPNRKKISKQLLIKHFENEIRPMFIEYRNGIRYINKPIIKLFSQLIVSKGTSYSIILYDCILIILYCIRIPQRLINLIK